MSARVLLGSSFVLLAAMPVVASLNRVGTKATSLAELFSVPQNYGTPLRLERTPRMDGVFRREEWDLLWGGREGGNGKTGPLEPVIIKPSDQPVPMTGQIGATPPGAQPPVNPPTTSPTTPPVTPPVTPPSTAPVTPPAVQPTTPPAVQPTTPPATPPQTPPVTPPVTPPTNTDQAPPVPTAPIKPPSTDPIGTKPATPPPAPSPTPIPTKPPVLPPTPPAKQDGNSPLVPTNIQPINPPAQTPPPAQPAVVAQPAAAPEPEQSTFMSWEPGKLYFGGLLKPGNDLLVTIDAGNNGFLVGKDNLELRVTTGATPTVKARILDGTSPSGPVWVDAPGFTASCTAVSTVQADGSVFVEVAVVDPGYDVLDPKLNSSLGLRVDSIAAGDPPPMANMPRATTSVILADHRVNNLPNGLDVEVLDKGRSVLAGNTTNIRWQLNGSEGDTVKSVEVSGEGNLEDKVNTLKIPNPAFDPHGLALIDYPTLVQPNTPAGYGVLKAKLRGSDDSMSEVESSIRVTPALDIVAPSVRLKPDLLKRDKVVFSTNIVSNTGQRVEGNFQVVPPQGWRVTDGSNKNFFVYSKGAKAQRQFVMEVPQDAHGTYRITIRVVALGGVTEQPMWVTIP